MASFDIKVVILGLQSSGKSCLLQQYVAKEWRSALRPTYGPNFAARRYVLPTGRPVSLGLWDTSGSADFENVSKRFIAGAHVGVVVCDLTSRPSWEKLRLWVHTAKQEQPGIAIYVACSKLDLVSGFLPPPKTTSDNELTRSHGPEEKGSDSEKHGNGEETSVGRVKFTKETQDADQDEPRNGVAPDLPSPAFDYIEVAQYCKAVGASLHVVSAKTGHGVSNLFHSIVVAFNAAQAANGNGAIPAASSQEPTPTSVLERKSLIQQSAELRLQNFDSSAQLSRGNSSAQMAPGSAASSVYRPQREGSFSNSPWHAEYVFDENGGIVPPQTPQRRQRTSKRGQPCRVS